jgi:hypothetical protein
VYTATDGGKSGGTTSLFVDLTTNPGQQRIYTEQLKGCTTLSVVSQNAMYMAHFWQDKSFIGYYIEVEDEDGEVGGNKHHDADAAHYITQFLTVGRDPATDPDDAARDGLDKLRGLTQVANHFQGAPGLYIYILTPGREGAAAGQWEYGIQIAAMLAQVQTILGGSVPVDIVAYEPPDDSRGTAELNRVTGGMIEAVPNGIAWIINVAMAY